MRYHKEILEKLESLDDHTLDIPPEKPQLFTWKHYLIIIPTAVVIVVVGYYAGKYITLHQLSQGQLAITCQK